MVSICFIVLAGPWPYWTPVWSRFCFGAEIRVHCKSCGSKQGFPSSATTSYIILPTLYISSPGVGPGFSGFPLRHVRASDRFPHLATQAPLGWEGRLLSLRWTPQRLGRCVVQILHSVFLENRETFSTYFAQCGKPNNKPTTWGRFIPPIYGDLGDVLLLGIPHENCINALGTKGWNHQQWECSGHINANERFMWIIYIWWP